MRLELELRLRLGLELWNVWPLIENAWASKAVKQLRTKEVEAKMKDGVESCTHTHTHSERERLK